MKTAFDERINEINIPESLDTRISMGFSRAKLKNGMDKNRMKKHFTTIAASLAIAFLGLGIIGYGNVGAAIKEALKYIPGLNVVVEKQNGDLLVLLDQLEVRDNDHYLTLKSAVQNGDSLHLTIESNLGLETMEGEKNPGSSNEMIEHLNLTLKDAEGESYNAETWSHSSGGSFWSHSADFTTVEGNTAYVLEVGGMKIDFNLVTSRGVDTLEDLGPYAKDQGVTIVGLLKTMEDKIRVDLVSKTDEGSLYSYPLGEGPYLQCSDQILLRRAFTCWMQREIKPFLHFPPPMAVPSLSLTSMRTQLSLIALSSPT